MTHYPERLREITAEADALILTAPEEKVSGVRQEIARFAQATARMERALTAVPGSAPTVQIARFLTAAEGALTTMQGLVKLIGHGSRAERGDEATERRLGDVIDALTSVADEARNAAVNALRGQAEASAEATEAWREKIERQAVPASAARMDALTEAFLNPKPKVLPPVPVVQQTKAGISRFWRRAKKTTASAVKSIPGMAIPDAVLDRIMTRDPYSWDAKSIPIENDVSFASIPYDVANPSLRERGLIAEVYQSTVSFMIMNDPPTTRTPVWDRVAKALCDDPDSLAKALSVREEPSFRAALREEMISALNAMNAQTLSGSPAPMAVFKDPILGAAIRATILAKDLTWYKEDFRPGPFDPFGMEDAVKAITDAHPGIEIRAFAQGLFLHACPSAVSPKGLAATLHASANRFKACTPNLGKALYDAWGDGMRIPLPPEAVKHPLITHSVIIAAYTYGDIAKWKGMRAESTTPVDAGIDKEGNVRIWHERSRKRIEAPSQTNEILSP